MSGGFPLRLAFAILASGWTIAAHAAESEEHRDGVRVATFNVRNYLCMDRRMDGRFLPGHPKPEAEKNAVRATVHAVAPDVLCLQEVGPEPFLNELQQDFAREGRPYPHAVLMAGDDTLRHVAVLSRLPFQHVVSHTDLTFKYLGRVQRVKRGLLEVQFAGPRGTWRLFVAHLKSPLTDDARDPGSEKRRLGEARAIRERILMTTAGEPASLYLIAGDLNASPDSRAIAYLARKGRRVLAKALPATDSRGETWTHFQSRSERYERVDYILASPGMLPFIRDGRAAIHDGPTALAGSDHRLVWTETDFAARDEFSPKIEKPAARGPAGFSEGDR